MITNKLNNKVIIIFGGTGSFGNAVVKRLIPLNPKRIIIFSRDEKKQDAMRNEYLNPLLHFIIGDVRDKDSVRKAMQGVDYVFHAAALKQVPSCEEYPLEAVKTNILGSTNVMEAAVEAKVKRLVILTTDKAVYPINAMGMTKALMEKIMVSLSKDSFTILCGVRYGNVLYSRGSVVPYFISLIKKNQPLQITNPNMTRFLLTLDDAVDLVLKTLEVGERGKIYYLGAPAATIKTIAEALCEIFDYPKSFEIVGAREGEKIHETLVASEVSKPFTSEDARRLNIEETKELLLTLPEIQLARK